MNGHDLVMFALYFGAGQVLGAVVSMALFFWAKDALDSYKARKSLREWRDKEAEFFRQHQEMVKPLKDHWK